MIDYLKIYVTFENGEERDYFNYDELLNDINICDKDGKPYSKRTISRWIKNLKECKVSKNMIRNGIVNIEWRQPPKPKLDIITIKEVSRINLGLPCGGNYDKCPFSIKNNCSDIDVRCNGNRYKIVYDIDGELVETIESAEFTKELTEEVTITMIREHLIESLKENRDPLSYFIAWNSI